MLGILLLLVLSTLATAQPSLNRTPSSAALLEKRDAYTNVMSVDKKYFLTSPGARPVGAYGRNFKIGGGSLFTWYSKSPSDAIATSAMIIIHGKRRDSANYWTVSRATLFLEKLNPDVAAHLQILNNVFIDARNAAKAKAE